MKLTLYCLIILWITKDVLMSDPCLDHVKFPATQLGLRNEKCSTPDAHIQICDKFLLRADWYVIEGGVLQNHCPNTGDCGNAYPAWMRGPYPSIEDGEVTTKACIKRHGECCKDHVKIMVKNCSDFLVYHLKPLLECSSAYCVESPLPCQSPDTTTAGFTSANLKNKTDGESGSHKTDTPLIIGLCVGLGAFICVSAAIAVYVLKKDSCRNPKVDEANKEAAPPSYDFVIQQDQPKVLK